MKAVGHSGGVRHSSDGDRFLSQGSVASGAVVSIDLPTGRDLEALIWNHIANIANVMDTEGRSAAAAIYIWPHACWTAACVEHASDLGNTLQSWSRFSAGSRFCMAIAVAL